jgi:hypothetical protein
LEWRKTKRIGCINRRRGRRERGMQKATKGEKRKGKDYMKEGLYEGSKEVKEGRTT